MSGYSFRAFFRPRPPQRRREGHVTLRGTVRLRGGLASNLMICYTIDGTPCTIHTDSQGQFCIHAPRGAKVIITPRPGFTAVVTPSCMTIAACQDRCGLSFTLMPLCC